MIEYSFTQISPSSYSCFSIRSSTAPGRGGVGIVRLSGTGLKSWIEPLTGKVPSDTFAAPRIATLTPFIDTAGQAIYEGLLIYFAGPNSFTVEDVIELHGHGGPVVLQLLLGRCLDLGARLAEPGEFTRRAFLNGKLDLAQAESVADLIEASTAAAARSAVRSLTGSFSKEVQGLCDRLIDLRMLVEATLDFPDEDVDFLIEAKAFERIEVVATELRAILDRARQGSLLRNGLHVVLVGQPNVGKSSLLNRLAGEERAIVTDIAGTTRDGLRETVDEVEKIGIARTWKEIERADVIVRLVDVRTGLTEADAAIDAALPAGTERITVFNKLDLNPAGGEPRRECDEEGEAGGGVRIHLSAKADQGVELLRAELLRVAGWHRHGEDVILARERHLTALRAALAHAQAALANTHALELMAEELRLAQEAVNSITGELTPDDMLGVIFSRFCIGK